MQGRRFLHFVFLRILSDKMLDKRAGVLYNILVNFTR